MAGVAPLAAAGAESSLSRAAATRATRAQARQASAGKTGARPSLGKGAAQQLEERRRAAQPTQQLPAVDDTAVLPASKPAKASGDSGGGGGFGSGFRDGAGQGRSLAPRQGVNEGAGVLLGFIAWTWVVLPFIQGGPGRVGAVLRAKLTNKGPDGSDLP